MEIANATENGSAQTQPPTTTAQNPSEAAPLNPAIEKWAGWPGHCVFRLIVPVLKVGSIIGRKGELIKKMCEETRARIRVLDGALGTADRIGSVIKSLQESTGASVRVLPADELPSYAAAYERIVELQGEALKVLKALEEVVGHLRKFLVDHSVLPLFEKMDLQAETRAEKSSLLTASQSGIGIDLPVTARGDSLFLEHETQLESRIPSSGISFYTQDPTLSAIYSSSGLVRSVVPIVTQIAQTMQIPFSYAEDIIGIGGANIAHIRCTSGAVITVQESRGMSDEITVEIKGTSTQVQLAQQLIQDFMSNHKDPVTSGDYGDSSYRSSYSQMGSTSSLSTQPYGGYGGSSSNVGGYPTFRL
ncbi:hypothetical protein F383_07534 [Gossypium arboreum]|uniref:K Homology domain-containing protein n=1 Tax=Gossypium arboreum TaxID=29729 RepID=A0A0B0MLH6_GOSAR|nr:hypothetical protein F383_07534 [Gossypium arboreum]